METLTPDPCGPGGAGRHARLRTVDVARRVGCSVQHVRDLERDGVLPPATRTPTGYRSYDEVHVRSAVAYRALAAAIGPVDAKALLRAVRRRSPDAALALLDDAHATLARERRDLRLARDAAVAIAAEPLDAPRPSDSMTITDLAAALGTTAATLRHWEAEGLLAPDRAGPSRVRTYSPAQVRDVRVLHQLRLAGYPIPALRTLLPRLLRPGSPGGDLDAALDARERSLATRSRALLRAAAALDALVDEP